ncbi:MAG TPA: hypothetical protein VJ787_14385 [Thermoleophilia bacterium]|nr:hypothetical protein [Thermoleophilia bacterium]
MDDYRVELFIFPDGMAIEMIVFDQDEAECQPVTTAATATDEVERTETTSPAADGDEVDICHVCHSRLVYPTDWERTGSSTWELKLRCPNCETQRTVTLDREGVERFNRVLYEGSEALARQAEQLERLHFEEESERFLRALDEGSILPMDF